MTFEYTIEWMVCYLKIKVGKSKAYLYSAFRETSTQGAQVWITQVCATLQTTPYLPLPCERSPDGATWTAYIWFSSLLGLSNNIGLFYTFNINYFLTCDSSRSKRWWLENVGRVHALILHSRKDDTSWRCKTDPTCVGVRGWSCGCESECSLVYRRRIDCVVAEYIIRRQTLVVNPSHH